MSKHGGKREGAGRRSKADEIKLIERIDNVIDQDKAMQKLGELVMDGNMQAVKLYFEYRYGKPKESIDLNTTGDNLVSFNDLLKAVRGGSDK